jgi:hypothetical protein
MSDNPKGKGGLSRMWARMKGEAKAIRRNLSKSHDPYVNFFVESCRHGPYLVGHLLAWFFPVLVVAAIGGWVLWLQK